jgi:hypothetical protein
VKTSILLGLAPPILPGLARLLSQGQEVEVHLDPPPGRVHAADRVFHHRHEQRLATAIAHDLERLA